nr:MarR family winged helix-turn-helix transcriptional regulator [Iamia sp. SCSIO 61187]
MDATAIEQVRRFHRTVTQRVGALDDRYLARDRPLGQARLLWEVGEAGCDVRELRARLGLDSGYVSRLLRALEADGLVAVGPGEPDRRVRRATLTARGRAERAVLDRRSDDLARSLVEPLSPAQRERLVAAMAEVERLVTMALVEVVAVDPESPEAQVCLDRYAAELAVRFPTGFDPGRS